MKIAMYQPDIPQNCGAMMRLCACTGIPLEIIEPCGFLWDERKIRTAAMDYFDKADITRHSAWEPFYQAHHGQARIVLMSTKASVPYHEFSFEAGDILLAGRESAGVPDFVHEAADARVFIPMKQGLRSLNIVNASAMILGEAMRQTGLF